MFIYGLQLNIVSIKCVPAIICIHADTHTQIQTHPHTQLRTYRSFPSSNWQKHAEKSNVMVNSTNNARVSIILDGKKLEEVSSFKYLGATSTKDGTCDKEIFTWTVTATAVMARLTGEWKSNISFQTKFKLYKSLLASTLLYGCETWHCLLTQKEHRCSRQNVFENKCLRTLLRISYWKYKTNEYVWNKV